MERSKLVDSTVEFFHTGSTLLDLCLGGGWASGRISNVVGDRSSGKTLLGIEAIANYAFKFPDRTNRYGEAEAAFDEAYARCVGLPANVERPSEPLSTVQDFYNDLQKFLSGKNPGIYVLDSLDALTTVEEKGRTFAETKTYGTDKAKHMSELFRKDIVRDVSRTNAHLMFISQVRDNIGVMFGNPDTRSGGRSLDFYSSQILWLHESDKIKAMVGEVEYTTGMWVKAKVTKLKVGIPFRETFFPIIFRYGVDDEISMLWWLEKIEALGFEKTLDPNDKRKKISPADEFRKQISVARKKGDKAFIKEMHDSLVKVTTETWNQIDEKLAPPMSKYGG